MKITCGLTKIIVLFAVVNNVTSIVNEQYKKLLLEKAAECKETNATERDINELMDGLLPTTRTAKCLTACVMNKFGVMNGEKCVRDRYARFMAEDVLQLKGSIAESIIRIFEDITEVCDTMSDPDKCESAFNLSYCVSLASKKRGFD